MRLIQAELMALIATPTTWLMGAAALVLVGVATALTLALSIVTSGPGVRSLVSFAGTGGLIMVILGVVNGAGPYRHGTILSSVLTCPRRAQVVAAQTVANATVGGIVGLASVVVVLGVALPWLATTHVALGVPITDIALAGLGAVAYCALSAALGLGLGALARNQVAAASAVLIYLAIVDPTLSAVLAGYSRFSPTALGIALSGGVATGNGPYAELLPALTAAAVYLTITLALVVAGCAATKRRDLS
ncbi:MAG: hypothetical protein ACYDEN_11830 [Acidimicrobiales bacterium]